MVTILKSIGAVIVFVIACASALAALVFSGIVWVFGTVGEFLSGLAISIIEKPKSTPKEENTEEVPVEV